MGWWRRAVDQGDLYYDKDWRTVVFQPLLYFFVFGASVRLAFVTTFEPIHVHAVLPNAPFGYALWLALGIVGPILALHSWLFIRHGGRLRIMGMWLRFSADVSVFTCLLTYHLAAVLTYAPTESRIFSRYVIGAVMIFVVELIVRDVWALRLVEQRARRMRRGK